MSKGELPRGELFLEDFVNKYYPDPAKESYPKRLEQAARDLGLSLVGVDLNQGWSRSLLAGKEYLPLKDFFTVGFINGPVARLVEERGFRDAMLSLRSKPTLFTESAANFLSDVRDLVEKAAQNGMSGIALADDIAGSNGLLFSPRLFHDLVLPVYREFAGIVKEKGLATFLHSDGDMRLIIDAIIDAGYECLHPIDAGAGQSSGELKKTYGHRLSFMGNIDLLAWDASRISDEIRLAEKEFVSGGLILGSTGGIPADLPQDRLRALYPKWDHHRGTTS